MIQETKFIVSLHYRTGRLKEIPHCAIMGIVLPNLSRIMQKSFSFMLTSGHGYGFIFLYETIERNDEFPGTTGSIEILYPSFE
jgi:hypothetical protein